MTLTITSGIDSAAQFFTIVVIFLVVLGLTYATTRWTANYQKGRNANNNVEIIEVSKIAANKYIEIVRCGDKYLAVAICKDTVTMLCELSKEQISLEEKKLSENNGFKEILEKAKVTDILEKAKDLKNNK